MTEKQIFVVTHGDKNSGINPRMTQKGFKEIIALKALIPENPPMVITGTGQRHHDVAMALGLNPNASATWAGTGDSLEVIEGKKYIILENGQRINFEDQVPLEITAPEAKRAIISLPHNSVVCAGRPLMFMLAGSGESTTVYLVTCKDDHIISTDEL